MIDAKRIVMVMTKKDCDDCDIEHWEFFASREDADAWSCNCKAEQLTETVEETDEDDVEKGEDEKTENEDESGR